MNGKLPGRNKPYHGVVVPMITPTTPEVTLDEPAVRRIIDFMIDGGVDGIFVLGTTGEAASIPYPVRSRLVALTVEHVAHRVPTYAGIGDNCLSHSVQAAEEYFRLGIDAVVSLLPSYYALTPEEQFQYYTSLADRVPGPLMLYNIPSTTHMSIPIEVVEQLSQNPKIIGLKDSERNAQRLETMLQVLAGRPAFAFLMGATILSAKALALGADGIVPSPAQLIPDLFAGLYRSSLAGDTAKTEEYQRLVDAASAIYTANRSLGEGLAGLKAAMGAGGLCGPDMWPPLLPLPAAERERIAHDFKEWRTEQTRQTDGVHAP